MSEVDHSDPTGGVDAALLDLLDPVRFSDDPYPAYHALLARPGWMSPAGFRVFARYDDVMRILRDPASFGQIGRNEPVFSRRDPPEHTRLRRLVSRAFTPKSVAAQREFIARIVDDLLRPNLPLGTMDLVPALAQPLPAAVTTTLLGVPSGDRERWRPWLEAIGDSRGLIRLLPRDGNAESSISARAQEAARATADYLSTLIEERKIARGTDVISALIEARDGDDSLTDDEVLYTLVALLGAGLHTTTGQLGNMIAALLANPRQLDLLLSDRSLIDNAVDEALRFDGALQAEHRVVLRPVTVGEVDLAPGDEVMIVNAAANRDPSVFDDPDRFNILRPNARQHIGFGFGIHRCLGAELAKSQLSIALDRVLRDLTGLRPAGEAVHHRFNRWRGLASLPVAWEPAT